MAFRKRVGRLGRGVPATVRPVSIPASVGGINARDSLMMMPPQDCIYTYNLIPSEYGLRLRKGFREWATGVPSDVRTVLPYDSQEGVTTKDRLFAVCAEGIYDVTFFNTTAPAQVVDFTPSGPDPDGGYGVWTHFTTDDSDRLVLYADSKNGLHQYNGDSQVWSVPAINNVDPADVAFVSAHKQRIWLVEAGSEDAWYLPVDAIAGDAVKFNFGSKFVHGGRLMGVWSWSVDGGDGFDDVLVAVSRAGDVLVYYGSDPSQPDWSLRGSYFVGEVPNSRRITVEDGGDFYILSIYGLTSLKDLLSGVNATTTGQGPASKIARFLREQVDSKADSQDWNVVTYPGDGFLQIQTPWQGYNEVARQFTMNLSTKAWGWWLGVPMLSSASWRQEFLIGGPDGIVYIYDGGLDNTQLSGELGLPIEFKTLTSFQTYGEHAQFMRPHFIRSIGIVAGVTTVNTQAVFDYAIDQVIPLPPALPGSSSNLWDTGLWDVDYWDFSLGSGSVPLGSAGLGRTMAIGLAGSSEQRVTVVGWDVMFDTGGLL